MKRILFILSTILLISINTYSQEQTKPINNLEAHIMPISLIDRVPRLRLGIEYCAKKRIAYDLELGYGNPTLTKLSVTGDFWRNSYNFFEIRPEIKYYTQNHHLENSYYFSVELFYMQMTSILQNSYFYKENSPLVVLYEEAKYNKTKYGLHFKTGMRRIAFSKLIFDFYFGIGIANRNIYYTNLVNPDINEHYIFEEWFVARYKYEGTSNILHFTAGMKMGLVLWKK